MATVTVITFFPMMMNMTRVVVMSARPGRITQIIPIDLPQPRNFDTRESARYYELITQLREGLRGSEALAGNEG